MGNSFWTLPDTGSIDTLQRANISRWISCVSLFVTNFKATISFVKKLLSFEPAVLENEVKNEKWSELRDKSNDIFTGKLWPLVPKLRGKTCGKIN